jgi:hypothetical protein
VTDTKFLERFEAETLSEAEFRHPDHIRLAWLYLQRFPLPEAISVFSSGLKKFASRFGKPERYHETITLAYLLLINERMARGPASSTWCDFAAGNADLFKWKGGILGLYYRAETLTSDLARRVFVFPEPYRAPTGPSVAAKVAEP